MMKRKDIERLHADGLISDEQLKKIIAQYHLSDSVSGRWLFICLSLLAASLIVGGVGMLVAAHWEELTTLGKTLSGIVLLAAAWGIYFALSRRIPLLAEGMALIGAALWGCNIVLQDTLFSLGSPGVEGVFLFFIGIVWIPFLTRQRLLVGVVAACSFVLLGLMVDDCDGSWLSLGWNEHQLKGNTCAAYALLGIFWWLLGEKTRKAQGMFRGYYWVGIITFLISLPLLQSYFLYHLGGSPLLDRTGYILLGAAPVLCLLLKPKGVSWLCWALTAAATCSLAPLYIHLSWHAPSALFGTLVCSLYAGILMLTGTLSGRVAWINYGALMALFVFIGVLSNIFESLETSGLALIISGSAMLVLIFLLESQRRRLIRKAKQQTSTTPSQA